MTEQQEKEIMDTLRLGFGFSDACDAFDKITSILSPLPHQDGASAEEVLRQHLKDLGWTGALSYDNKVILLKAMHQFAQSEVAKVVAELIGIGADKDRSSNTIATAQGYIEFYNKHSGVEFKSELELLKLLVSYCNSRLFGEWDKEDEQIEQLRSELSTANARIKHLEQGMANWVRVANERQTELNEAKRRVKELEEQNKKYYFMIEHGLGIEDMMPPTYPHP